MNKIEKERLKKWYVDFNCWRTPDGFLTLNVDMCRGAFAVVTKLLTTKEQDDAWEKYEINKSVKKKAKRE